MSSSRKIVDRRFSALAIGIVLMAAIASLAIGIPRIASAVAAPAPVRGGLGIGDEVAAPLSTPVTAESKFGLVESAVPAPKPVQVLQTTVKSSTAPLPKPAVKPAPKVRAAKAVARPAAPKAPAASGGWKSARVSWYGPGFYGRKTANGTVLTPSSMVVAHRSLPFGTRIEFAYRGRTVVGVVADRGPFVGGRTFDLGPGVATALGFGGVQTIQYRILGR